MEENTKKENASIEAIGIKCDNPECNFNDPSVKEDDYPNWVDRACPLCGANLLTKDDYTAFLNFKDTIAALNSLNEGEISELNELFKNTIDNLPADYDELKKINPDDRVNIKMEIKDGKIRPIDIKKEDEEIK